MKNIHILPTDKPSRLVKFKDETNLLLSSLPSVKGEKFNIYITNSEEIKEGDSIFETDTNTINVVGKDYVENELDFKIILTTDQSLDGVQAIDDDFLEWFVKNPSCEEVEIDKGYRGVDLFNYKIIIPKKEPNQDLRKYPLTPDECYKQETLEEAAEIGEFAEKKYLERLDNFQKVDFKDGVFEGAKWQQKRMYNEEEVRKISLDFFYYWWNSKGNNTEQGFDEWFEQFKKK